MKRFPASSAARVSACLLFTSLATCAGAQTPAHEAAIRRHRMGTFTIQTAPGAAIHVEQMRHEFWFGCAVASDAFNGGMTPEDATRYKELFRQNFNAAVTEVALKWHAMEEQRGDVHYEVVDAILAWADQMRLPLRGHNIYWGIPNRVPEWQKTLDDPTLHAVLQARGEDIGRRYKGRFAEYDLNNEMIHANYYADRFGPGITLEMAQWVRSQDPDAKLFLNDYDILTCNRLDQYIAHIRELLAMGVPIAGIGVQGHLHGDTVDFVALEHALHELSQFNLPIRVTEFNFPGQRSKFINHPEMPITPEEEAAKARAITDYYRLCFAHPMVEGILMWGFWAGANWIPQSSLYRRDWTPTPAAQGYRDLVFKEWWTRWDGVADANGQATVPAFFGTYRVTSREQTVTVELRKKDGVAKVTVR